MATLTQGPRDEGFIISEANGARARDRVTLVAGFVYEAGTVLGRVTANGAYAPYDPGAANGLETAAAILCRRTDATAAEVDAAVISRDAEVQADALIFADGTAQEDIDAAIADLAENGVIAR
jgi:hypothetical protein